jgi:anti-sigma factor RsiW
MTPTDDDLVLYADNALSEDRKQRLLEAAEHDPELAATLAALDASQLPYKTAFERQPLPPLPDQLRQDISNLTQVTRSDRTVAEVRNEKKRRSWYVPAAQAACLLLSVGVGFGLGVSQDKTDDSEISVATNTAEYIDQNNSHREWVNRVADYQTLYVANTVNEITPDLPATRAKLERIAKATGIRPSLPDLSASGYEFVRAQELGYNGQPLVQLVYTKEGHTPLALCFMPSFGEKEQHVRLGERHGLGTASWIADNQYYVIVADEPADTLKEIYTATISSGA